MSNRDERVKVDQLDALEAWCYANDIYYERTDCNGYYHEGTGSLTREKHIIKGLDRETDKTRWDCIIQLGSFGAKEGLLEYWDDRMKEGEDPEGYLTWAQVATLIRGRGYLD